ncbi:MAG: MBL fold metallo-hydrolase [Candidatus ainarchaeum sp.]|nr:MBL fold metallo-hydrolase [Candidatus ainarchaeum sp.]MDD5095980.1 MBL fold metallo-hydrolase [Candidatus ainarchaeum sp.]
MELFFIGTGGGRINLLRRFRSNGGFRINGSLNIHVDPGPGALADGMRHKQDPLKLDAVVVTHHHIDHCNDASLMVEGMSHFGLKKNGILIGSRQVIGGDEKGDRGVDLFHQSLCEEIFTATPGKKKSFKTKDGEFSLGCVKAVHDSIDAFGFKLEMDGKTIGYTSDTEYYKGIEDNYKGCDVLVINVIKPAEDPYEGHMNAHQAKELIKKAKPGLAILSHLGMKMIFGKADMLAKEIWKETKVKTIAARDGMGIRL